MYFKSAVARMKRTVRGQPFWSSMLMITTTAHCLAPNQPLLILTILGCLFGLFKADRLMKKRLKAFEECQGCLRAVESFQAEDDASVYEDAISSDEGEVKRRRIRWTDVRSPSIGRQKKRYSAKDVWTEKRKKVQSAPETPRSRSRSPEPEPAQVRTLRQRWRTGKEINRGETVGAGEGLVNGEAVSSGGVLSSSLRSRSRAPGGSTARAPSKSQAPSRSRGPSTGQGPSSSRLPSSGQAAKELDAVKAENPHRPPKSASNNKKVEPQKMTKDQYSTNDSSSTYDQGSDPKVSRRRLKSSNAPKSANTQKAEERKTANGNNGPEDQGGKALSATSTDETSDWARNSEKDRTLPKPVNRSAFGAKRQITKEAFADNRAGSHATYKRPAKKN